MDKSEDKKSASSSETRLTRFTRTLDELIAVKTLRSRIIFGIVLTIIGGLACYILWSRHYIEKEVSNFRKMVVSKKILSTIRKECKRNPDLDAYNKCLNSKLTASVERHSSKLYAKLKSICSYDLTANDFPYCLQYCLRKFAWDSKDLVLKFIAISVIKKLKDPPSELKDDADKYYGDAVKLERKGRLVFITPVCPCKSESTKKTTK